MISEFQPVILAAGEGSKMFPLTEETPKCLLPVGNYPLIWYCISYLERYGFNEFLVIVRAAAAQKISQTLQTLFHSRLKFDLAIITEEQEDAGTAASLAVIRDKVKTDLLVVSCDLVTDTPLYGVVDLHRVRDSSFTCMLQPRQEVVNQEPQDQKKGKVNDPAAGEKDFSAVDPTENRLLLLTNEADLETDSLKIGKQLLTRFPNLQIRTDLVDAHLYIMKKWLFDYITKNVGRFESLKSDLVPHVIRKQFLRNKRANISNTSDEGSDSLQPTLKDVKDIFNYACADDLTSSTSEWSSRHSDSKNNNIKCHAYVSTDFCLRVNNLPAYSFVNKQIMKLFPSFAPNTEISSLHSTVTQTGKCQVGPDCLVGESTSMGEHVTVKKSVIGKHCTIGSKVKINNCVIMNYVNIKDNCVLTNSIVCDSAYIQEKCQLTSCQVGNGQTITANSNLKDESITQEEMDLEDEFED